MKRAISAFGAIILVLVLSGCVAGAMTFEDFNRSWKGIPATITTYDQAGELIDQIKGTSLQVSLDERFTVSSVSSDGTIISSPGDVLLISVGKSHMSLTWGRRCSGRKMASLR